MAEDRTLAALTYPDIDPVALRLGPLQVRWYGLAYVVAFVAAGLVFRHLMRRWRISVSDDDTLEVVVAAAMGVLIGARLGYVLFYGLGSYWRDPISILALWDGGMSFHGGLAGIVVAGVVMARRIKVPFLRIADAGAVGAPVGFFFGRLANFVNGELWGRPTEVPWGMVFPGAGPLPRHPSQLYESVLEGLVIFVVMWVLSRKRRERGTLLGWMLVMYGAARFSLEFFREPDSQLGFILGPLTMGQLLTLPMLLAGVGLLVYVSRRSGREASSMDPFGPDI